MCYVATDPKWVYKRSPRQLLLYDVTEQHGSRAKSMFKFSFNGDNSGKIEDWQLKAGDCTEMDQ
jgi:hypothetical protein